MDFCDSVAQVERNIVVIQTLRNVAGQAGGIWHQLEHSLHMGAFQGHSAGHNHTDIAGTQNNDLFAGHAVIEVHVRLRSTGREHAGRTFTGDAQRATAAFLAAHS